MVPLEKAAEREVVSLFYMLQRELIFLQTDGSCSSLALSMTIRGLVYALKLVWIQVVYEASSTWSLVMGPGQQSPSSVFPGCFLLSRV